VKSADCSYVIQHGSIHEQGTHRELVAKGGIYAKLVRYQDISDEASAERVSL